MKKINIETGMVVEFVDGGCVMTGVIVEKGVYQARIEATDENGGTETLAIPYKDVLMVA
jgi:hypothetical protein